MGSAFPSASKLRGAAPWKKGRLWFGKIVAHGTVGGASSAAQGGSFQDGFRSAGFTQLAAPVIGSVPGDAVGRTAAAAVVGGTASRLGGGKFANGAQTGAFSYLFTQGAETVRRSRKVTVPGTVKNAVEQTFGEALSVDNIRVIENSRWANFLDRATGFFTGGRYGISATTQVDTIYLSSRTPATGFFGDAKLVLHEYYHVIRQWNTGELTNFNYLLNSSRWESEAQSFARDNVGTYRSFLNAQ